MNPINRLVLLALFFLLSAPSLASAQSVPELAKKALAATVSLEMQDSNGDILGQGSGFFVRPNLIATNFHVIDGAVKAYAKLVNTATPYTIEGVTATDETYDLALLKVTAHGVTPLPLGDSDAVQIGETVYVAGNPLGFEGTFSDGIISGRRESFTKKERLQMTAPISPGSSGGPVLNPNGEVIGVSTSVYNPLFGQNLNFAVPSNALKALLHRAGEAKPFSSSNSTVSYFTYLLRGYEKVLLEDSEGAIQEFSHAIRLNPDNANSYVYRGIAKASLGRYSAAILDYDAAIRLDPNDANAYLNRGYAKIQLGQHYSAIADCDAAIRLDPNYAKAYYNRGYAKGELRRYPAAILDYDAAILDYDAAIRLDPNDAKAYFNRGYAKRRLGRYPAAILDYDAAIRLDPNYAKLYVNRGYAKRRLGRYSAAILDYNKAIDLDSNDAHAYFGRGLAQSKLYNTLPGWRNQPRKDFRIALRLATLADNQNLKARIEKELRQLEE